MPAQPAADFGDPMYLDGSIPSDRHPRDPNALRRRAMAAAQLGPNPHPNRMLNELFLLVACLACGLLVVPVVFWFFAHAVLGPYTRGQDPHSAGPMVLLRDFFAGLGHGSPLFWVVALGPAVMLTFARLAYTYLRPPA